MKKNYTIFILLLLFVASCYYDKEAKLYPKPTDSTANTTCDTANVSFATVMKPLFDNNCNNGVCHSTANHSSNIIMDTYAGASAAFGNYDIICIIKHNSGCGNPMPKGRAIMDDCTINKFIAWQNKNFPQ